MADSPSPERRRHPRTEVSWPVVVETSSGVFLLETVNLGPHGAKVRATDRLNEGTSAMLHFHPPGVPPIDISAVVWRIDPDGLVFFFVGILE